MSQTNLLFLHVLSTASNTSRHGSCTDHQQRLLAEFRFFRVFFVPFGTVLPAFWEEGDVFGLEKIKFFPTCNNFF